MTTVLIFLIVFMLAYGIYFVCTHLKSAAEGRTWMGGDPSRV